MKSEDFDYLLPLTFFLSPFHWDDPNVPNELNDLNVLNEHNDLNNPNERKDNACLF